MTCPLLRRPSLQANGLHLHPAHFLLFLPRTKPTSLSSLQIREEGVLLQVPGTNAFIQGSAEVLPWGGGRLLWGPPPQWCVENMDNNGEAVAPR